MILAPSAYSSPQLASYKQRLTNFSFSMENANTILLVLQQRQKLDPYMMAISNAITTLGCMLAEVIYPLPKSLKIYGKEELRSIPKLNLISAKQSSHYFIRSKMMNKKIQLLKNKKLLDSLPVWPSLCHFLLLSATTELNLNR